MIITTKKYIIETDNKTVARNDSRRNIILYTYYIYYNINTLSICNPRTIVIIKSYYRRKDIQRKY